MTGRFPQHVNMHNLALSVPGAGIPLDMTTIASKLKTTGYATHAVVSPAAPCSQSLSPLPCPI